MPDIIQQHDDANGVRSANAVRPSGLPIFSTEPLTHAERQKLLDLQWSYRSAALQIELCLGIGRVDVALETLQSLGGATCTRSAEIAATLGSHR